MRRKKGRPPKKYIQLLDYLELRGSHTLLFRELLGNHRIERSNTSQGTSEIVHSVTEYCFPRETLARLLKKGVNEGLIEKIPEPREKGKRGRPAYLYGLSPGVYRTYPGMRFKDAYFFGVEKNCKYGKTFLQLYPHFQEMKTALIAKDPIFAKAVKQDHLRRKKGR